MVYKFEQFELDPKLQELRKDGASAALHRRALPRYAISQIVCLCTGRLVTMIAAHALGPLVASGLVAVAPGATTRATTK